MTAPPQLSHLVHIYKRHQHLGLARAAPPEAREVSRADHKGQSSTSQIAANGYQKVRAGIHRGLRKQARK